MAESLRGIFRWSGTQDPKWDTWYPLSVKQILKFPVCEQCGIAVDYLVIDPGASAEEIQEELELLRDWVLRTSDHGHHHMPNGQLASGQELPRRSG